MILCHLAGSFFKTNFVKNFFHEYDQYDQSVKQFGSKSGLTLCLA